jgi:hypothetical protein
MANSKAPKHDFAPAWLKIPSIESVASIPYKLYLSLTHYCDDIN